MNGAIKYTLAPIRMAVAVVNWRQLLAPQNILSGATVLCGATSVVWRDFRNRFFCWRHNMAPYTAKSAKLNRHISTARALMAPLPGCGATSNRHMAIGTAIWRLTTAMADLPISGATWRHAAPRGASGDRHSPNIGDSWRYRHVAMVQSLKKTCAKLLSPNGAIWRH